MIKDKKIRLHGTDLGLRLVCTPKFYSTSQSNGIITAADGRQIETKLSSEELFEQTGVEYEDMYEYYMD